MLSKNNNFIALGVNVKTSVIDKSFCYNMDNLAMTTVLDNYSEQKSTFFALISTTLGCGYIMQLYSDIYNNIIIVVI